MARILESRVGRYRLLRPLGRGCRSTVHEVEAVAGPHRGERLALKLAGSDAGDRQSLQRDAYVRGCVGSDRIVALRDFSLDTERPFLVMDLGAGRSLEDLLCSGELEQSDWRQRAADALGILIQVLSALDAVHEAVDSEGAPVCALYGDLHPANVLVGESGRVQLTDFGCSNCPRLERLLGPPRDFGWIHGLAPERARGSPIGPPSDLFSAGSLLYKCLCGRDLYCDESGRTAPEELFSRALRGDVGAQVGRLAEQCPDESLLAFVVRSLRPEPELRFRTAAAMSAVAGRVRVALRA